MLSFRNYIKEAKFSDLNPKKGEWKNIPINFFGKDSEINKELFDLIDKSYQYVGGHANYKSPEDLPAGIDGKDVIIWYGVDIDDDPEPDAASASKKTPYGEKSVLGASDGSIEGKTQYVLRTMEKLNTQGNYAEMSGAIAHIMISRHNVPFVDNQEDVEKILGKKVEWIGAHPEGKYPKHPGWYKRKIGGEEHMKILLGKPNLNMKEEIQLKQGEWEIIATNSAKEELGEILIDLVQTAYSKTPKGSFIKTIKDIIPSNWFVINLDSDPEAESTVFYRKNRSNENWIGYKIQGIGHDGQTHNGIKSSKYAVDKIVELINQNGWWIECSDALRYVLLKRKSEFEIVQDVNTLRKIFNDPKLEMVDDITYKRSLSDGQEIVESLFGKPILKKN